MRRKTITNHNNIAKTAIISKDAKIHKNAIVKDYAVVGSDVEIDAGTVVESHAVVHGPTKIGKNNRIYSFASIGGDPQDIYYNSDEESSLVIGDNNIIREFCTINRGTNKESNITRIGSDNLFMAYTHIAHDCKVGNWTILSNNASLAGHVKLNDYAILGGFTLVKQFCEIGAHTYIGMGATINKDIPPFLIASDNPTRIRSINNEGLKRRKFSVNQIAAIKRAFKAVYRDSGTLLDSILKTLEEEESDSPDVLSFIEFIRQSKHGIMRGEND
ncbi:Acyl-[acyl-carrier-protein]--UDP-N-acetylglucosamine O-acyltransferase [hydrothermal vent metagenome]|uniref:Acyl-[acyl-carrier-protein]--UDP-N-acetylglucosamine O-acyltransferase n=1 Tax=hydrothermal vent metagenome TaxID=652676 RepID=A0A1W1BFC7_9ZZZZ